MLTPNHILSPKNGKPIICFVQDAIVSLYIIKKREGQIKKQDFDQLLIDIEHFSRYDLIMSILGRTGFEFFYTYCRRTTRLSRQQIVIFYACLHLLSLSVFLTFMAHNQRVRLQTNVSLCQIVPCSTLATAQEQIIEWQSPELLSKWWQATVFPMKSKSNHSTSSWSISIIPKKK